MATARPIQVKTCNTCGETKPLIDFYTINHKNKDGQTTRTEVRPYCKKCDNKRRKNYSIRPKVNGNGATKPQPVSADDRSGAWATTTSGYHMDTRAVQRLRRIAKILVRENWRDVSIARNIDTQRLAAAGMPVGDIQIMRKAINHEDETLLHFIFNEQYSTAGWSPPGEVITPEQPPEPTATAPTQAPSRPTDSTVFIGHEVEVEPAVASITSRAQAIPATLSDLDIEAAAELIVNSRIHISELEAAVKEYEDRLQSIRDQLATANQERMRAIALLRRAQE